jgi:hypothetical protein
MEYYKIIIIVNIDFGTEVHFSPAVFQIKGVKMVPLPERLQILFSRAGDMRPPEGAEFNGFDHNGIGFSI